jgi:TRAP-type C4-dicarboxylate transport system permease small subunit
VSAELDPLGAASEDPPARVPLTVEKVLIAAAMAAMALITAANVATRYLTDVSLAITEEYSVVLMVVVALLGTALATACGRHIRIGVLVDGLPPRARRGVEIAGLALTVLMFGVLAWYGASLAWDEYRFEVLSGGLGNPQWWYTGWLPLLSVAVVLRALGRMVRLARGGDG